MRAACILVALALLCAPVAAKKRKGRKTATSSKSRIEFRVYGLASGEGWVICRLYNRRGWLKKAGKTVTGHIERRAAVCVFEGVAPGAYAVAAFHDENKNGEVDVTDSRKPAEGVCTSNNWSKLSEKPPFQKARFHFAGGVLTKAARMRYAQGEPDKLWQ